VTNHAPRERLPGTTLVRSSAAYVAIPVGMTFARILPYLLSWGVLAVLIMVGMHRVPFVLYTPIDGEWAKWNVEAILKFGKVFDLSPYNMLAGMGSMYLPNLPWLNPGALALALPIEDSAKNIISYSIYTAELAASIVLLARVIGFSWLTATVGAQLYLYLLFSPFSEVFQTFIGNQFSHAPHYAHLIAVLNAGLGALLSCGQSPNWRHNLTLAVCVLALFISGILTAPFTFIFFILPYVVIGLALIVTQRRSGVEWTWKASALASCVIFFVGSGLLSYYLGTIATSARTPISAIAWDQILSLHAWLDVFRDYSPCSRWRSLMLLCMNDRGSWLLIAGIAGAAVAILTQRGGIRTAGTALIAYVALVHIYAPISGWFGPAVIFTSDYAMFSIWSFVCIFVAVIFLEPFRMIQVYTCANGKVRGRRQLASLLAGVGVAVLLAVVAVEILAKPYGDRHYRAVQLVIGCGGFAGVLLAAELMRSYWNRRTAFWPPIVLSILPILALVHLSLGVRKNVPTARDTSLRDYLRENASIALGQPFRGYVSTIWLDKNGEFSAGPGALQESGRYIYARDYFLARYGETFTETDLWRSNIPTFEEYGQWTSVQAHAFAARLLRPVGFNVHPNFLRVFTIDLAVLRAVGVRYILTDAEGLDRPAILRGSVSAPDSPSVRLFELIDPNLGTYSPTHFVKAATANEIAQRIEENKDRLDQVAVVTDDLPSTTAQARSVVITIERDGVRIQATSDGPTHVLLPLQFLPLPRRGQWRHGALDPRKSFPNTYVIRPCG
jgi:hypothetical protein